MKRSLLLFLIFLLILSLGSCGTKKEISKYEQLSYDQKCIVDTIFQNQHQFSDCNSLKLAYYNGSCYLRADYVEWSDDSYVSAGHIRNSKIYLVENGTLEYMSSRDLYTNPVISYGIGGRTWKSSWSKEEKLEVLANMIKISSIF